jgi:hypothetical protein
MPRLSRRGMGKILLAPLFCRLPLKAQAPNIEPAAASSSHAISYPSGSAKSGVGRTYRADANILFLGMSIYRREGVGSGKASIEETTEGAAHRRALFFAAGSDAKRAHGFNRLGWMREVVTGPVSAPSDISYFGVLTSSPEESLDHARKSAADSPPQQATFSAVNGRNTTGRSRSAVARFDFPSAAPWSDQGLIDRAHAVFQTNIPWRETSWPNSLQQAPPTFLSQLTTLLAQRARRCSGRYVYNEQEYLLELESQRPDPDAVDLFAVRGQIRNLRTGHSTRFRVWLEDGSELPVRIEFQARSFLKLTFTAVPA